MKVYLVFALGFFLFLIILISLIFINKKVSSSPKKSLFERLGGIYSIAAVVNHFSDAILENPLVGVNSPNPYLREWSRNQAKTRLPGLKFMRTLWVANVSGGPYNFVPSVSESCPLDLENAHKKLQISPQEFDEVAKELEKSLLYFSVPLQERNEVLAAFMKHKNEINKGYFLSHNLPVLSNTCSK